MEPFSLLWISENRSLSKVENVFGNLEMV